MFEIVSITVGQMQSNCHILYSPGSAQAVVIDPGAQVQTIISTLDRLSLKAGALLLTHGHFDHIGAVDSLLSHYGCRAYISKRDLPLLKDSSLNLSEPFGSPLTVQSDDIVELDAGKVNICGTDFDVIPTPGHTDGSVCYLVDNMLFTGDTLFYQSIGNDFPPYGNVPLEIQSINDRLFTLPGNPVCYPGHGINTCIEHEKTCNPYLGGLSNGY